MIITVFQFQSPGSLCKMSVPKADGITMFTFTSKSKTPSPWGPLFQILKSPCYRPLFSAVFKHLSGARRASETVLGVRKPQTFKLLCKTFTFKTLSDSMLHFFVLLLVSNRYHLYGHFIHTALAISTETAVTCRSLFWLKGRGAKWFVLYSRLTKGLNKGP